MKIKVSVRLEWKTINGEELILKTVFKHPNKLLKVKLSKCVFTSWLVGNRIDDKFKNRKEFQMEVMSYLSNKELIIKDAVGMVFDFHMRHTKTTEYDLFTKEVREIINKQNENFEIEVELK